MTGLLPPNATPLERAVAMLAEETIAGLPVPLNRLWSPWDCTELELAILAWSLSIDDWDASWPIAIRRARVAAAIDVQRTKGSLRSLNTVVNAFGGSLKLREWPETGGVPHTFELVLALGGQGEETPTEAVIDALMADVRRTKPARSHFTFTLATMARGRIGLRGVARALVTVQLDGVAPAAGA